MIVPVMATSNLVLTRQIYSEETNGAHAHNRDRVPLSVFSSSFLALLSIHGQLISSVQPSFLSWLTSRASIRSPTF